MSKNSGRHGQKYFLQHFRMPTMTWTASSWSTAKAMAAMRRQLPSLGGFLQAIASRTPSLHSPAKQSSSMLLIGRVSNLLFSQLFKQSQGRSSSQTI